MNYMLTFQTSCIFLDVVLKHYCSTEFMHIVHVLILVIDCEPSLLIGSSIVFFMSFILIVEN